MCCINCSEPWRSFSVRSVRIDSYSTGSRKSVRRVVAYAILCRKTRVDRGLGKKQRKLRVEKVAAAACTQPAKVRMFKQDATTEAEEREASLRRLEIRGNAPGTDHQNLGPEKFPRACVAEFH